MTKSGNSSFSYCISAMVSFIDCVFVSAVVKTSSDFGLRGSCGVC